MAVAVKTKPKPKKNKEKRRLSTLPDGTDDELAITALVSRVADLSRTDLCVLGRPDLLRYADQNPYFKKRSDSDRKIRSDPGCFRGLDHKDP